MTEDAIANVSHDRRSLISTCLVIVLLALVVFRVVLGVESVLFTTDNNIGNEAMVKRGTPASFVAGWGESPLLGQGGVLALNWTNTLLWLMPLRMYMNWIHAIDLVLGSIFMVMFLRARGVRWTGCLFAALVAYWIGTNLTLTYAGHTSKFAVVMFASLLLWVLEKAAVTRKAGWAVLAGGALGLMFLEQQDVALFFGFFVGAYAIFTLGRSSGWSPRFLVTRLLIIAIMGIVIAGPTMMNAYTQNIAGAAAVSEEEDPEDVWNYCTQWSVPVDETIDFIAPGYTGWRSGEMSGPYWGRTGQDARWDWEKVKDLPPQQRPMRNLRLESIYIGSIPIIMAFYALFIILAGGEEQKKRRAVVMFWAVASLVALLLSYGRYFPLYRLFWHLPVIHSIRNPNKFVQVFQLSLAVLAGFGFDMAVRSRSGESKHVAGREKKFVVGCMLFGTIVLIAAASMRSSRGSLIKEFAEEWGQLAPVIVKNIVGSLMHGGLMACLCAAALWFLHLMGLKQKTRNLIGCILILLIAADAFLLSRHYIKSTRMDSAVGDNAVTEFLDKNLGYKRVVFGGQGSFYNHWLTVGFPYHNIATFTLSQMPRMPEDYKMLLAALQGQRPLPTRLWELGSACYMLAPVQFYASVEKEPSLKGMFEPVFGYNVFQAGEGIGVSAVRPGETPQHVILRFKRSVPRYGLFADWEMVPDDKVLGCLANPAFDPLRKVLVSGGGDVDLPMPQGMGPAGSVSVVRKDRANRIELSVKTERSCILMATDRNEPSWRATVNGKPAALLKCNYICHGVFLEKGEHDVVLECVGSKVELWIQMSGLLVCVAAAVILSRKTKKTLPAVASVSPEPVASPADMTLDVAREGDVAEQEEQAEQDPQQSNRKRKKRKKRTKR